jgi:outer membrane lipoprotein-sorting protein
MIKYIALCVSFYLVCSISNLVEAQNSMDITRQMFDNVKSIKTIQYSFESKERVGSKTIHEISDFKLQIKPYKVYMKEHQPTEGVEVLFVTGENSNKAKVNPNAFPWATLNLDPEGSLMLENHHHSIYDSGFDIHHL